MFIDTHGFSDLPTCSHPSGAGWKGGCTFTGIAALAPHGPDTKGSCKKRETSTGYVGMGMFLRGKSVRFLQCKTGTLPQSSSILPQWCNRTKASFSDEMWLSSFLRNVQLFWLSQLFSRGQWDFVGKCCRKHRTEVSWEKTNGLCFPPAEPVTCRTQRRQQQCPKIVRTANVRKRKSNNNYRL